jgi:hypothetical protein
VRVERIIFGANLRNDIGITGSRTSGISSEDIDISIVSLASQATQSPSLGSGTTEDDTPAERTAKIVDKHPSARSPARNWADTHSETSPFDHGALPRWNDRERCARLSQVLENGIGWRSVLCTSQAALPRSAEARVHCFEP